MVEIAGSNDDGMDKKKHWVLPYLSIGNQMRPGAGQLSIDRERFKVGYAVKQLPPWWITGKLVEIAHSNDGMDKKKHRVSPFFGRWQPREHRDGSTVHGKKDIWGQLCSETVTPMMNHRKSSWNCGQQRRNGQEKASGLTILWPLATKRAQRWVYCARIERY